MPRRPHDATSPAPITRRPPAPSPETILRVTATPAPGGVLRVRRNCCVKGCTTEARYVLGKPGFERYCCAPCLVRVRRKGERERVTT